MVKNEIYFTVTRMMGIFIAVILKYISAALRLSNGKADTFLIVRNIVEVVNLKG